MNEPTRATEFQKPDRLESLLRELNGLLAPVNSRMLPDLSRESWPKIFVHGPLRSGTTLMMQWLSGCGLAACPTNMLSRFYAAPLIGARIQQLLTDPAYNFRKEILDFSSKPDYRSENGKTRGALSPNEFWYFWRRFLPFAELDYLPDEVLKTQGNLSGLTDELNALANLFAKPFALKAMIANQNIAALNDCFERALFIQIHREPIFNMQSALEARQRQYGSLAPWYSFRIREYPKLKDLDPLHAVAGQIAANNRSIELGLAAVPADRQLRISYEAFCADPAAHHTRITRRLSPWVPDTALAPYTGPERFPLQSEWRLTQYSRADAEAAWREMDAWARQAIATGSQAQA